jgi:preprotein translocase subunit SecD
VATRPSRPGRTLIIFFLMVAAMYAGVIAAGNWSPNLGLDLQGGTRITLSASTQGGNGGVTPEKMSQAVDIIRNRVNGTGVTEAEVSTQGGNNIIVEIPGEQRKDIVDQVGKTAQLRFRLVAPFTDGTPNPVAGVDLTQPTPTGPSTGSPSGSTTSQPSGGPTGQTSPGPSGSPTQGSTAQPSGAGSNTLGSPQGSTSNRVVGGLLHLDKSGGSTTPSGGPTTPSEGSTTPSGGSTTPSGGSTTPSGGPTTPPPGQVVLPPKTPINDPETWVPDQAWETAFLTFVCPKNGTTSKYTVDDPTQPMLACDDKRQKFLLGPAIIEGTQISNASAGIPQNQINWSVQLSFDSSARDTFGRVTTMLDQEQGSGPYRGGQFAIVLDSQVISYAGVNEPILNGSAEITGNFDQQSAQSLANSLKYGALPLTFRTESVTEEGPELASDQLRAGIIAGIIGLLLVVVYCLLYYRGLGLVVISSLIVAGAITYALVLLLGSWIGFTLTLPGIAGLIVAIGITADSFIVYFERLRDEVRGGRTLRTAVEAGWVRARLTILAADAVSFLAALVLYIFAIGVVKGFAFALGLTTLIDVLIVFMFTKPIVTLLARTKFFGDGHRFSGLDPAHLGVERLPALRGRRRPVGGEA